MLVARAALAVLVAALMGACAGPSPSPTSTGAMPAGFVALRTQESPPAGTPEACMAALIEGTLARQAQSGVGLRDPRGFLIQVIWPNGYAARDDAGRLVVLDASGSVVAREGDRVSIGGGYVESEATWLACGGTKVVAP